MNNRYQNNKEILKYVPHFYDINNSCFKKDDKISLKLKEIYHEYIFSINILNKEQIELCKDLDKVVYRYLIDFDFRKEIQENLFKIKVKRDDNILQTIVKSLISLHDKFLDEYTRRIYIPKWI